MISFFLETKIVELWHYYTEVGGKCGLKPGENYENVLKLDVIIH